jgi:hypothetical protein
MTLRDARQAEVNPAIENPGDRMASVTIGHCHEAGHGKAIEPAYIGKIRGSGLHRSTIHNRFMNKRQTAGVF